jgi:hypothetical protein
MNGRILGAFQEKVFFDVFPEKKILPAAHYFLSSSPSVTKSKTPSSIFVGFGYLLAH